MTIIEMLVHMDCGGCESKVWTMLRYTWACKNVTVTGWAEQKKVLRAVRKTGRRAEVWQLPHNPELHFDANQYHCNGAVTFNGPQPTSSYNYYKHGYDIGHPHPNNYYQRPSHSAIFSDDNPNACSIM